MGTELEARGGDPRAREAGLLARLEEARRAIFAPAGFVRVEGGAFRMGDRDVTVTGFWMGARPVTQREWFEAMGSNPSHFKGHSHPVDSVSWRDAAEYANRKSLLEKLEPAYVLSRKSVEWDRGASGYRLPTEAEWEYAARGGDGSPGGFEFSGSDGADEVAWHNGNSGGSTNPVGTKAPNALGLYDMSGNVWEWCWDWHSDEGADGAAVDPAGAPSGTCRVLRGGSWGVPPSGVRCSSRNLFDPSFRDSPFGFRLVRPLD